MEEKEAKMVVFFGCVIIGLVISRIIARIRGKDGVKNSVVVLVIGIALVVSFWGGSLFLKKEIVVEKYVISPMIFDGKTIAALMEEHKSLLLKGDNYIFQTKKDDKTKTIRHYLKKEDIFFSLNEDEERRLEIKKRKTCGENMWIWFFYSTVIIEDKAVLKNGDNFLTLPKDSL